MDYPHIMLGGVPIVLEAGAPVSSEEPLGGANIVRLNSESVPSESGARFLLRMALAVPPGKEASCMATVANTASQLNLKCHWQQIG